MFSATLNLIGLCIDLCFRHLSVALLRGGREVGYSAEVRLKFIVWKCFLIYFKGMFLYLQLM